MNRVIMTLAFSLIGCSNLWATTPSTAPDKVVKAYLTETIQQQAGSADTALKANGAHSRYWVATPGTKKNRSFYKREWRGLPEANFVAFFRKYRPSTSWKVEMSGQAGDFAAVTVAFKTKHYDASWVGEFELVQRNGGWRIIDFVDVTRRPLKNNASVEETLAAYFKQLERVRQYEKSLVRPDKENADSLRQLFQGVGSGFWQNNRLAAAGFAGKQSSASIKNMGDVFRRSPYDLIRTPHYRVDSWKWKMTDKQEQGNEAMVQVEMRLKRRPTRKMVREGREHEAKQHLHKTVYRLNKLDGDWFITFYQDKTAKQTKRSSSDTQSASKAANKIDRVDLDHSKPIAVVRSQLHVVQKAAGSTNPKVLKAVEAKSKQLWHPEADKRDRKRSVAGLMMAFQIYQSSGGKGWAMEQQPSSEAGAVDVQLTPNTVNKPGAATLLNQLFTLKQDNGKWKIVKIQKGNAQPKQARSAMRKRDGQNRAPASFDSKGFTERTITFMDHLKTCTPHSFSYPHPFVRGFTGGNIIHGKQDDKCRVDYHMPNNLLMRCKLSARTVALMTNEQRYKDARKGRISGSSSSEESKAMTRECETVTIRP